MKLNFITGRFSGPVGTAGGALALLAAVACGLLAAGSPARATDLQQLIEQVGADYGEAYASPFIHAFGPNQNANLFSTASIPYSGLTFGIGIKVMGTHLNEADQTFRKVVQIDDLGIYDPTNPAWQGVSGTAVMSGPTIFGDTENPGRIDVITPSGIVSFEGIPGFWDTRWVPLATPEAYIGGVAGLKFTLRYFPSVKLGDFEKTSYLGYGLQWSANGVLKELPIDVMAGFFLTSLDVENTQGKGQDKLFDSQANSYFLAVSKSWPILTVYGGFALEDSEMKVAYYSTDFDSPVNFTVKGRQESRFTLGLTLDTLMDLNLEAGFGDMSTYSAGLMFGF